MKLNLMMIFTLSLFSMSALAGKDTQPKADPSHVGEETTLTDGQILSIVEAADDSEIAAARQEKEHGKSAEVKNFAKEMIDHHGANKKDMMKLAKKMKVKAEKTNMTDNMHADAKADKMKMEYLKGADLDHAYINNQVAAHEKVLKTLDEQLIPQAKNEDLKAALQETRTAVSSHLEEARALQGSIADKKM